MAKAKRPVPAGYHTVTPVLALDDCNAAIEWYKKGLGAEEIARSPMPDGKLAHAELQIGDSRVMVHDAIFGGKGPLQMGGSPMALWIYVDDCDALYNRAVAAGAKVVAPVSDMFWGDRFGQFTAPDGYTWSVATRKEDLTPEEMKQRQEEWLKSMEGRQGPG